MAYSYSRSRGGKDARGQRPSLRLLGVAPGGVLALVGCGAGAAAILLSRLAGDLAHWSGHRPWDAPLSELPISAAVDGSAAVVEGADIVAGSPVALSASVDAVMQLGLTLSY